MNKYSRYYYGNHVMQYPKGFFKGFTKQEQRAYLSGKLPSTIKIPCDELFDGRNGLMRVLGYEIKDAVRVRGQGWIIYKLVRNT